LLGAKMLSPPQVGQRTTFGFVAGSCVAMAVRFRSRA
jgi:hypothetical protein